MIEFSNLESQRKMIKFKKITNYIVYLQIICKLVMMNEKNEIL